MRRSRREIDDETCKSKNPSCRSSLAGCWVDNLTWHTSGREGGISDEKRGGGVNGGKNGINPMKMVREPIRQPDQNINWRK